jgi:hypothetical protein
MNETYTGPVPGRGAQRQMMRTLHALLTLLLAAPAWAALGEHVDSVARDTERLRGEVQASAREGYAVHQITAAGGTLVREYVTRSGFVFGVAWEGPSMPDLAALLGSHYAAFRQAVIASGRRRAPVVLSTGDLVVESSGHMRAFRGRAYVPGLVPPELAAAVVR